MMYWLDGVVVSTAATICDVVSSGLLGVKLGVTDAWMRGIISTLGIKSPDGFYEYPNNTLPI